MNYFAIPGLEEKKFNSSMSLDIERSERIIIIVARHYLTTFNELKSASRKRELVEARQMIFYFLNKYTKKTLAEIGKIFNRNHATVIYSIKNINNLKDTNRSFDVKVRAINTRILS